MKQHDFALCMGRCFTLIELLIVIAIIAVLAGMLLPALSKTKEHVATLICTSKVKQVNQACLQYTGDFNDYFPTRLRGWTSGEKKPGFPVYMAETNMITAEIVSCDVINPWSGKAEKMNPLRSGTVIGLNPALSWNDDSNWSAVGSILVSRTTATVKAPAGLISVAETCWGGNNDVTQQWSNRFGECPYFLPYGGGNGVVAFRHNSWSTTNMGFLDGHAVKVSLPRAVFVQSDAQTFLNSAAYFGDSTKPGSLGRFKLTP